MKEFTVHEPKTDCEFREYYLLRWKILRKPFNKKQGNEKDNLEKDSIHIYIKNNSNSIVAVGRLHLVANSSSKIAQIRFMAVDTPYQKLGLGKILLKELESRAKKISVCLIILHARDKAVTFYEKNGYKIIEKSHLLFNQVQHWLMHKKI